MDSPDLAEITLSRGPSPTRTARICLPEAVAWFAGEEHSDRPRCVSPVLLDVGSVLCDRLPEAKRQRLKAFVPALVDTADDGNDDQRSRLALDWLVRVYSPAWLRVVPELDLAAASLAERAPVLTVSGAAAALSAPRDAVATTLYTLYGSQIWREWRARGARLRHAVSQELIRNAGEAAVAGTIVITESALPVCGKIKTMVEASLLIAACLEAARDPLPTIERLAADVVARAAEAVEDAAIEWYARMIGVPEPADRDWLADDVGQLLRRLPRSHRDS